MTDREKPIKVLHFSSTSKDNCGIGKYSEACIAAMIAPGRVENDFFDTSPYQLRAMPRHEMDQAVVKLKRELKEKKYDILHVQHEFGLFWSDEFAQVVAAGKHAGVKVVVTMHLSPSIVKELHPVRLRGLGPRSFMMYLRQMRHHRVKVNQHLVPMRMADMVIVHNDVTRDSLVSMGVASGKIKKLVHPVYPIEKAPDAPEVAQWLNKQPGDIILCMAGFLHRYKGTLAAVKSLKYLPDNYKLLLAGSVKGDSDEVSYEDEVADTIDALGLKDRVYITGYVKTDTELNAFISACDVCVFPYDRVYYSSASSGVLNLAFTNLRPVVAYPTESIKEAAREVEGAVVLTETFSYYEIAREVKRLDLKKQSDLSRLYAEKHSWDHAVAKIADLYEEVLA